MPVAVVTDSTTYLPRELIERWRIEEVSLYVGWGDGHRPEHEYDLDDFYKRLRESDDHLGSGMLVGGVGCKPGRD